MTARAWLPEPPCDICTVDALARVGEPLGDELLVELAIQLARRIVRHVQDLDRAAPPRRRNRRMRRARRRSPTIDCASWSWILLREKTSRTPSRPAPGVLSRPLTNNTAAGGCSFSNSLQIVDRVAAALRRGQSDHEQRLLVRGHEPLADGFGRAAAKRLGANVEPMHAQRDVAEIEQVAIAAAPSLVADEHADVDRQVPRQARYRRQHGVAAERRRLDVDQHALDARLRRRRARAPAARPARAAPTRSRRWLRSRAPRSAGRAPARARRCSRCSAAARCACARRAAARAACSQAPPRCTAAGRDEPQAADRRRQRVHVLEADVNVLTQGERHRFDVARAARGLDRKRRRTRALRARERVGRRHLEPQPLARADELHVDDLAGPDDGHAQQIAHAARARRPRGARRRRPRRRCAAHRTSDRPRNTIRRAARRDSRTGRAADSRRRGTVATKRVPGR